MAKVTYITPSGNEVVVEDAIGNLMEIAREYDVEGIEGMQWLLLLCNLPCEGKTRVVGQNRTCDRS